MTTSFYRAILISDEVPAIAYVLVTFVAIIFVLYRRYQWLLHEPVPDMAYNVECPSVYNKGLLVMKLGALN